MELVKQYFGGIVFMILAVIFGIKLYTLKKQQKKNKVEDEK